MPERASGQRHSGLLLAGLAGSLLAVTPVSAHKLHVFAYAEGATIRGEVYARGGEMVHQAVVTAYGPGGERLGEAATDKEGKFVLKAAMRCDHRLVADAGGGHQAEFTLTAAELPDSLPPKANQAESPQPVVRTPETPEPLAPHASPVDQEQILAQLAALERQIVQLRKQIDGYEEKTRWHDVLGGLGYILGLMGLAYYFLGRKKARPPSASP